MSGLTTITNKGGVEKQVFITGAGLKLTELGSGTGQNVLDVSDNLNTLITDTKD